MFICTLRKLYLHLGEGGKLSQSAGALCLDFYSRNTQFSFSIQAVCVLYIYILSWGLYNYVGSFVGSLDLYNIEFCLALSFWPYVGFACLVPTYTCLGSVPAVFRGLLLTAARPQPDLSHAGREGRCAGGRLVLPTTPQTLSGIFSASVRKRARAVAVYPMLGSYLHTYLPACRRAARADRR